MWYVIIVAYVNTIKDVYKIIWGISIALVVGSVISSFTGVQRFILNPIIFFQSEGRLASIFFGSSNEYPGVLVCALCFLPMLYYRSSNLITKIIIVIFAGIMFRDLLTSVTRGAFLAFFLSLFWVFFFLRKHKKAVLLLSMIIVIIVYFANEIIIYFITERLDFSAEDRPQRWLATLEALFYFPHFFTGFGMATLSNVKSLFIHYPHNGFLIHYPHNGFLFIWMNSGLIGIIGFSLWIIRAIKHGIKKIKGSNLIGEKVIIIYLVVGNISLLIFSLTTGLRYTGGEFLELYTIFTTQVALLIIIGQKQIIIRQ